MYGSQTSAIWTAERTRVGLPSRSTASCRARALMTVASMPMVSLVARSIPSPAPIVPRQMLPPPTTTAISTPNSSQAAAISRASLATVAASMVSSEAALASASPESLSTTLCQRGFSDSVMVPTPLPSSAPGSGADDHLGEAREFRAAEQVGDGALLVADVGLLEQHLLLEPPVQPPLDDLRERRLGFLLVPCDRLGDLALRLDPVLGHVGPDQVLRPGERDVDGDVVGELLAAALQLHEHGVHTAAVLDVEVAAEDRTRAGDETLGRADGDVLLEEGREPLDPLALSLERLRSASGELRRQLVDELDELGRLRHEVRLALECHDGPARLGAGLRIDHDGDGALGALAVGALARRGLALLAEPLLGLVEVAASLLQRLAAVEDAGAGALPQLLDGLCADLCHDAHSSGCVSFVVCSSAATAEDCGSAASGEAASAAGSGSVTDSAATAAAGCSGSLMAAEAACSSGSLLAAGAAGSSGSVAAAGAAGSSGSVAAAGAAGSSGSVAAAGAAGSSGSVAAAGAAGSSGSVAAAGAAASGSVASGSGAVVSVARAAASIAWAMESPGALSPTRGPPRSAMARRDEM